MQELLPPVAKKQGARAARAARSPGPSAAGWHAIPLDQVQTRLQSGVQGLDAAEAAARLGQHGANVLPQPARRSVAAIIVSQLRSPLIYLLLLAALISCLLGEYGQSGFIALVLAINTTVGSIQELRAEASSAALSRAIRTSTRTSRDGAVTRIDSEELVPGDVVMLEAGDRVPADLRIIASAELQVDEASLTGESFPVAKAQGQALPADAPLAERPTMLFAGSTVQRGRGEAFVVATGPDTELGRIARSLVGTATTSPLLRRLERFSEGLGIVSLVLVGAVVILSLGAGEPLRETFFIAVALAVAIIPEGLPVAITVTLSIATRRMARRHVIVRHLPAVEALGSCTVVATDKTGTLTVNQLSARRLWLPGHGALLADEQGGFGQAMDGTEASDAEWRMLRSLARSAVLCSDASYDPTLGGAAASGDPVDLAFLMLAARAGVAIPELRAHAPRLAELPFDAGRKLAASLNGHGDDRWLHVKGAAEAIVPLCLGIVVADVLAVAEEMAAVGYRVLAVAKKPVAGLPAPRDGLESELNALTLLGLVGFIDPLRPEARRAVADCQGAGVTVKMITGDHAATALSIARELGIAHSPGDVVSGREIAAAAADDRMLQARVTQASVFARVEPAQKLQIVDMLRSSGHIVAMTGDGVNDAPALQRADLGVAMGLSGTDVAREAADLVLSDDNFASIAAGIEEGRAAYANIRKVIYLLISTGAAEVVLFLLSMVSGLPVPLTAVQLLWLNLATNGGQDVALAFEKREPGLLQRPPRRPDEAILDRLMVREVAVSGAYMGFAGYLFFAWSLAQGYGEFESRNMLLFLLVLFENVHVLNCRSETRSAFRIALGSNRPLIAAVISAQALHIGVAFVPGLSDILQVEPISVSMWLLMLPIAASVLIVMEIEKALRAR